MNLLAEIREGFGISWAAIRANKMRSGLTTLGIIIGIVTVTLMGATITGLDRAFLKSISALGADVFYVQRFNWLTRTQEDWLKQQKRRPIRIEPEMARQRPVQLDQPRRGDRGRGDTGKEVRRQRRRHLGCLRRNG